MSHVAPPHPAPGTAEPVDPVGATGSTGDDGPGDATADHDAEPRTGRLVTWGAAVLFALLRLVVVVGARAPAIVPDEPGSWAVARALGSGSPIRMQDMPRYPLVPGALLAPLLEMPFGPAARYRIALVLLSGLTVAAALLVRSAVARLRIGGELAPPLAFALVLLFPATMTTGAFTWAEPTVVVCWAVVVWGVVALRDGTRAGPLLAVSLVAGLAPSVHGRLIGVPAVWLVALAALAWTGWRGGRSRDALRAAAGAALTIAVAIVSILLTRQVTAAAWTASAESGLRLGELPDALVDPRFWGVLVTAAAGQAWYVLTSSLGLALAGVALLGRLAVRPRRDGDRVVGLTLGSLLAANLGVSVLTLALSQWSTDFGPASDIAVPRWDHLVYGRYNDAVTLVLAALGTVTLLALAGRARALRLQVLAAGALVATAAVTGWRMARVDLLDAIDLNVAGVAVLPGDAAGLPLWSWTLAGVALTVAVGVAARTGRQPLALALAALLAVGAVGASARADRFHAARDAGADWIEAGDPPPDAPVAAVATDAALDPAARLNLFAPQVVLVPDGWRFEFPDRSSTDLVADPGDDTSLVVVTADAGRPAGGWRRAGELGDVVAWARD